MFTIRAALRRILSQPLLPGLAVGVLVLGIGSSTAVLGVAYAALLRPLPYPAPDELVIVTSGFPGMHLTSMGLSGPESTELGQLTTGFRRSNDGIDLGFGYEDQLAVGVDANATRQARVAEVSSGLLRALGPAPIRGRLFSADDDRPGGPQVVVLAREFWEREFGGRSDAVGRVMTVNGTRFEVIGVMPSSVDFVDRAVDLWVPLHYDVTAADSNRANHVFTVIGRRRADTTLASLEADVVHAESRWSAVTHQFHTPDARSHPLAIAPLVDGVRGPIRKATLVLSVAVILVLVMSAANAAMLLVASADTRQREMAVRAALGAGPRQLLGMVVTEAAILCAAALVGGLSIAAAASRAIAALAPPSLAHLNLTLAIGETVMIAASVTLCAAIACTAGPFLRMRQRRSLASALLAESRSGTDAPHRLVARRALIALEVALALTLFSGAALMVQSFWRLSHVDLGFDPAGVTHASITLPASRYQERGPIDAFYNSVMTRLASTPGVTHVGVLSGLPPDRRGNNSSFQFDGQSLDMHAAIPPMQFLDFISDDAPAALGIVVKAGRAFGPMDLERSQPVAMLNEQAARTYFPGASPIGKRLRMFGPGLPWMTIVGVVRDVRQHGLNRDVGTEVFIPIRQANNAMGAIMTRDLDLVVRATSGTDTAAAIRGAVHDADDTAAISSVETMDAIVGDSISPTRFLTLVLAAFAGVALLLSASGVYGIVMHDVTARMTEIGVRRSLGAGARAIAALVIRTAGLMVGIGLAAGMAGSIAANRALASLAFDTDPQQPARLAAMVIVLGAAAVAACAIPLARALAVDPVRVLRR